MSPEPVIRQLRWLLQRMTVSDDSETLLFGDAGVRVAADSPDDWLSRLASPSILLNVGQFTAEPEQPWFGKLAIEAFLFVDIKTDPWGAEGIFRLLRYEQRIADSLYAVGSDSGFEVSIRRTGASRVTGSKTRPLAYRSLQFEARGVGRYISSDDFDPQTASLTATVDGVDVDLAWTRPNRYDLGLVSIRRSASAIASASDGTEVTSSSSGTTFTDSPGSGTWYYAAFYTFDPFGDGSTVTSPPISAPAVTTLGP